MTLALLYVLAAIDGALCGFRSAGGRSPLIRKRRHYTRALLRGLGAAQVASLVSLVALVVVAATSSHRQELRADLEQAAGRMLWIFVPYAIVILGNLALRLVPSTDIRSATSVMVLGPLTALRPTIMVAGVLYGIWNAQLLATRLLGAIVLGLMLGLELAVNCVAERAQRREMHAILLE